MFIPVKHPNNGETGHFVSSKHITDIVFDKNCDCQIVTENGNVYAVDTVNFDIMKFIRISNYRDRCSDD